MNATTGSRRGSIASTHPEDVDLGWLAWKESRRNESRRWRISDMIFHQLSLLSISRNKNRRWKKSGLIIITCVIINLNRWEQKVENIGSSKNHYYHWSQGRAWWASAEKTTAWRVWAMFNFAFLYSSIFHCISAFVILVFQYISIHFQYPSLKLIMNTSQLSNWTKAVNAVTDQAARENGREHKRLENF